MKFLSKRLAVISVAGILFIGCAVFYVQYFMLRSIGSGPAGPQVDAAPFAEVWTDRPVRLVGIGDSVTAGLGADSPSHSYFNRLLNCPDDEFPEMQGLCLSQVLPHLTEANLAISGSTSRDHLHVIEDRLPLHALEEFGLVVMTSGGNDLIHSYGRSAPKECAMYGATLDEAKPWIEAFRDRLEDMLVKIEASFPGGCEIYLADIYDPTDGIGDAPSVYLPNWNDGLAIHAKYNEAINEVAASHASVHIVPMHKTFLGHGAHSSQFWRSTYVSEDPHYWFYHNIEDPNDRGYDAIRRVFLNTIVENSQLLRAP